MLSGENPRIASGGARIPRLALRRIMYTTFEKGDKVETYPVSRKSETRR